MEEILNRYYENGARRLHRMVDNILSKFGGISNKDYDDFYSIANEVFTDVIRRYDNTQPFDGFLYSCLSNKIKTEITARNRYKRQADRNSVSLDTPVGDSEDSTIADFLYSSFDIESEIEEKNGEYPDDKVEKYLSSLSNVQRQIVEMKMAELPVSEIKKKLGLTNKQYEKHCQELKTFAKITILYENKNNSAEIEEDNQMNNVLTQTMEKSKPDRFSIASIIKKMDKHTIRFDHPLQRESEQWSPSMKGNLISDILQGNPIPPLVFAEQVVNGIAIIWDLDGKQRCTNAYTFVKGGYKITKNIRRWMIEYQAPVVDENGNTVFDKENFPIYEKKEFDIRGKRFSDLPEELQEKFRDYNFEIVQYLNCSSEDIAYHIARYNEGKPMTASQKGITRLGEEYAGMVKAIANMPFFKDMGGYKVSEFKNGTINRVVVESVMAANYLDDWKKKQEDMCEFIRENATSTDFDNFEDMVRRLEEVVTDDVSDLFDSKNSFLWFGLFAKFIKSETDDRKFVEFMAEFSRSLHSKEVNGTTYDELCYDKETGKIRATKDKYIVILKMELLVNLMNDFLHINKQELEETDVYGFVIENVNSSITQEDIEQYQEVLDELTLNVDNSSRLLDEQNRLSLIALVAYSFENDMDMDDWIVDFFDRNSTYISKQKENYLYMKDDLEQYFHDKNRKSA